MCQWPQSIFNPDFEKLAVIKYSELSLWYLLISPYSKYLLVFIVFPRSLFIKNLLNWFEFKTFHIFIIFEREEQITTIFSVVNEQNNSVFQF